MSTFSIGKSAQTGYTLLSNDFIDRSMVCANGEFVKVYLYLLRHSGDSCPGGSLSAIADDLNHTENDVLRAFRYWESEGLISLTRDDSGEISEIVLLSPGSPTQDNREPEPNDEATLDQASCSQKELRSLFFVAEQYLGRTLTKTDLDAILYFYESLHMSARLIEYLIESCVASNHKSIHYIRQVAISWSQDEIRTVSQAKERSSLFHRTCYSVMKAFGIKNRSVADSEVAYVNKWSQEYGFSTELITEACRRTLSATHQPSFEYADRILTNWHEHNVHHISDIAPLDQAFRKEAAVSEAKRSKPAPATKNLNNFERRTYDMDLLEKQLLQSN